MVNQLALQALNHELFAQLLAGQPSEPRNEAVAAFLAAHMGNLAGAEKVLGRLLPQADSLDRTALKARRDDEGKCFADD